MEHSPVELSRMCEQNANAVSARSRTIIDCGPFRALLDPSTDMIWVNYAVPVGAIDDAQVTIAALAELRRAVAQHQRRPRFEFNTLPWPKLPSLLESAGFELQDRHPLMVCTPHTFRRFAAPDVAVRFLGGDDPTPTLAAAMALQSESFGGPPELALADEVKRLREQLRVGSLCYAFATLNGMPAGAGSTAPIDGVAELAGVATTPALRRRGVAATLTSFLAEQLFAAGGTLAWLSAGDAAAQAVYERVGFTVADTRLNYIEPA
ncbi:MAG: GNAT family N-acetyltransferase [Roseiflexaceae bacterium]